MSTELPQSESDRESDEDIRMALLAGSQRLAQEVHEYSVRRANDQIALTLGIAAAIVEAMTSRQAPPPELVGDAWRLELVGDEDRSDLNVIAEHLLHTGTVALAAPLLALAGEWANRELLPEDELSRLYDLIPVPDGDDEDDEDDEDEVPEQP